MCSEQIKKELRFIGLLHISPLRSHQGRESSVYKEPTIQSIRPQESIANMTKCPRKSLDVVETLPSLIYNSNFRSLSIIYIYNFFQLPTSQGNVIFVLSLDLSVMEQSYFNSKILDIEMQKQCFVSFNLQSSLASC